MPTLRPQNDFLSARSSPGLRGSGPGTAINGGLVIEVVRDLEGCLIVFIQKVVWVGGHGAPVDTRARSEFAR